MQWTIVQPMCQHDGTIWEWWDIQTSTNVNDAGRHIVVSKNMGYSMLVDKLNCDIFHLRTWISHDLQIVTYKWHYWWGIHQSGRVRHLQHCARLSAHRYPHRECLPTLMWQRSVAETTEHWASQLQLISSVQCSITQLSHLGECDP